MVLLAIFIMVDAVGNEFVFWNSAVMCSVNRFMLCMSPMVPGKSCEFAPEMVSQIASIGGSGICWASMMVMYRYAVKIYMYLCVR